MLPDAHDPPGSGAAEPVASSDEAGRRAMPSVLLISADVHALHVMKSSLDRAGFEVDTALGAEIGRRLYAESDYDALVIEQGAGSLDLCRDVLAQSRPVAPCVLMLAGSDEQTPLPEGVERLEKPLSLRYLVGRLTGQCGYFALSA